MTLTQSSFSAASEKALLVRVADVLYALPLEAVVEVLPALPVEACAACSPFVKGVVSLRGQLLPVVAAAERLGLPRAETPREPHIVCVRVGQRLVGVEVDEAIDLIQLEASAMLPATDLGAAAGFFLGLRHWQGEILRLLDPARLLEREETLWETAPQQPDGNRLPESI